MPRRSGCRAARQASGRCCSTRTTPPRTAVYLDAARRAADALIFGQHPLGGWHYFIDFDPKGTHEWYETTAKHFRFGYEEYRHYYGNATFDDHNTSDAAQFLLRFYATTLDAAYRGARREGARLPAAGAVPQRGVAAALPAALRVRARRPARLHVVLHAQRRRGRRQRRGARRRLRDARRRAVPRRREARRRLHDRGAGARGTGRMGGAVRPRHASRHGAARTSPRATSCARAAR